MQYYKAIQLARQLRKNQTAAEEFFWKKVRKKQLLGKKFLRQYLIQHDESQGLKRFFIADFCCYEKKLIVEIDGDVYNSQLEYDKIREDILREMGFEVIRFQNADVLKRWPTVEAVLLERLR